MPIFEYKCNKCETKFEVLHKTQNDQNKITCPQCNSTDNKKLFSSFSASVSGSTSYSSGGCADGSCGISDAPSTGGCSSGFCGLN